MDNWTPIEMFTFAAFVAYDFEVPLNTLADSCCFPYIQLRGEEVGEHTLHVCIFATSKSLTFSVWYRQVVCRVN